MLGRYEPEFEVKLMLRTDLDFEEKTFIEEKINLYVESYDMMLHDDGMTYSLKSPYEIGQGLYRPPKVRPKNLTIGGRYFYG